MTVEELPVVICVDCDVRWGLLNKPPACFGTHRHELNGIPVIYHDINLK